MSDELQELIRAWDGHATVARFDQPSGAWIFICLHDPTLGPCSGGTRMKRYPSPAEALRDGQRLAEGMTQKWAAVDLPYGGGKAVIALGDELSGDERIGLLHRYGRLIESLGGLFQTGEDLGTTPDDLLEVSRETRFVHGFDASGAKQDPSIYTARGVYAGICAALDHVFGSPDPANRSVLVQGVGNVGRRLAVELAHAGARVRVSDLDTDRAESVGSELDAEVVPADRVYDTPCDVYAPCAVGGTLSRETIPRLDCRIVAGSANNQLADRSDARRLQERSIVYAPDFILNAGGAISFAMMHLDGVDEKEILGRIEGIGTTIRQVLARAAESGDTTLAAAEERVARHLAAGRE